MMTQSGSRLLFLLLTQILLEQVCSSPQLFDWSEDRGRRRRVSPYFSDQTPDLSNSIEDEPIGSSSKLNIGQKDSPYALIHEYFPLRENEHQRRKNLFAIHHAQGLVDDPPKGLDPEDVWLSEGNLLVLKGGTADDTASLEEDWEPIDDYQAPYREPKLPPPDFVPNDIGVGVPLEEEDEDESQNFQKNEQDFQDIKEEEIKDELKKQPEIRIFGQSDVPEIRRIRFHKHEFYVTPPPHFAPTPRFEPIKDNEISIISPKRHRLKKLLKARRQPRVLERPRDRYVSFFRGSTGNSRSWSYSYNL